MAVTTAIVWFRRDLRLADNPALADALARARDVVALYVHAPDEESPWAPGAASRWWLHHSLEALDGALRARGASLTIIRGPSLETLLDVARASGASSVHWNRAYEPSIARRDIEIEQQLRAAGLATHTYAGNLLFEPRTLSNGRGAPFRVFAPFWRRALTQLGGVAAPLGVPRTVPAASRTPRGIAPYALDLLPRTRWDAGFGSRWTPGEAGALARLDAFFAGCVADYAERRDRPDLLGTARLSPHLHFGELSPRQVLAAAMRTADGAGRGIEAFLRELGWREFTHHVLDAFPRLAEAPLDARFEAFEWRKDGALLAAWQHGRTGVPLVDAGMRELWTSGWMHNRIRMVVASFLTKNLGQSWLDGARWFHDTLVDADLANNAFGWQWAAGCGADAAPYHRIFNPVLQAERFDPARTYLRTWLPELSRLPDQWLHRPFTAPSAVLAAAGIVLGRDYPLPIVDLGSSRARALAAWRRLRIRVDDPKPSAVRASSRRRTL